ncbi:unnamed protein product, partial [Heterosigma akashiwo]
GIQRKNCPNPQKPPWSTIAAHICSRINKPQERHCCGAGAALEPRQRGRG